MKNEEVIEKLDTYLEDEYLHSEQLISDDEIKSAQMILNALEGHCIIRAEKVLDYCKLALKMKSF